METIRVIEAAATPSIRDSVPPDSALRFNPGLNITRKRERGGSVQPNGLSPSGTSAWQPNKRQRVSELDPDQPIQSRETDFEVGDTIQQTRRETLSDSRELNAPRRSNGTHRDVRAVIQETPPPQPLQNPSADQQRTKSPHVTQHIESRILPPSANAPRARSASHHNAQSPRRGISASSAATSSLSIDPSSAQNALQSSTKRNASVPVMNGVNGKTSARSPNEDRIYDNIESDSEDSAAVLRRTKASLKIRNSPRNGLPGLDWGNKFSTPTNGSRRNSRSRESPSELPLTPSSRQRAEKQRLQKEAEDAGEVRRAAADAAEERQREAEESRLAERERVRREDEERDEREKRAAVIAKATKLEQERVAIENDRKLKEERLAEASRREQAKLNKAREQAAHSKREEAEADRIRQEAERVEHEKAAAIKAQQLHEQKQKEQKEAEAKAKAAAEEARISKERTEASERRKSFSASAESSDRAKLSTPARETSIRPQSTTPFIPSGRKSALKPSASSQTSSSPVTTRTSPSRLSKDRGSVEHSINGVSKDRRVSFDRTVKVANEQVLRDAPIIPGTKPAITPITPTPKSTTPKSSVAPKAHNEPAGEYTSVSKLDYAD